jgi:hypothetical protein
MTDTDIEPANTVKDIKQSPSITPSTRFRIPFDTGNVDVVFSEPALNNREKATLIGYMVRNIGLALTVMSKFSLFGVTCDYKLPKDIPDKLQVLGRFESTARVNEWDIKLTNNVTDYTLKYESKVDTDNIKELFE